VSPNNTTMSTSNSWEMGQGLSSYQSLAGMPQMQDGSPFNFHPSSDFSSISHLPNSSSTNTTSSSANVSSSSLAPTMNGSALDPLAAMEKTLSQHDFGSHHDNISNINSINHKSPQNQMISGSSSNLSQGRANGNKNSLHQTGQQQQNIQSQSNRSQSNQNQQTNMNCSSSSSPHSSAVPNCSPNGSMNSTNGHGSNGQMSNINGNTNGNSMTNIPGGPHTPHTPLTPHTPHTPSNMGPPSVSNSNGSNSVNNSYTGPSNSMGNTDLGELNFDPAAVIEGEGQGQEGLNVSIAIPYSL